VTFHTGAPVQRFEQQGDRVTSVHTSETTYDADWIIVTAGLGSELLTQQLGHTLPLMPVLGQGLRVRVSQPLGQADFQPVVNGDDIHLVPLGDREYGVAATVEFPDEGVVEPLPREEALKEVWAAAIAYCPALENAEVLETWYGLRPRPQGQAAPVIKPLEGYANVILATGHYRNGVLLAPATAQVVQQLIFGTNA
jgi:glycine/D-amino acid oxidase-like deaminating enzyme